MFVFRTLMGVDYEWRTKCKSMFRKYCSRGKGEWGKFAIWCDRYHPGPRRRLEPLRGCLTQAGIWASLYLLGMLINKVLHAMKLNECLLRWPIQPTWYFVFDIFQRRWVLIYTVLFNPEISSRHCRCRHFKLLPNTIHSFSSYLAKNANAIPGVYLRGPDAYKSAGRTSYFIVEPACLARHGSTLNIGQWSVFLTSFIIILWQYADAGGIELGYGISQATAARQLSNDAGKRKSNNCQSKSILIFQTKS